MLSWESFLFLHEPLNEEHIHRTPESLTTTNAAIVLVQGLNVYGERVYCYMGVDKTMFFEVHRKLTSKHKFDLRDFGKIVATGPGDPDFGLIMELEREHHMLPAEKND